MAVPPGSGSNPPGWAWFSKTPVRSGVVTRSYSPLLISVQQNVCPPLTHRGVLTPHSAPPRQLPRRRVLATFILGQRRTCISYQGSPLAKSALATPRYLVSSCRSDCVTLRDTAPSFDHLGAVFIGDPHFNLYSVGF